jgi:hypothetical protein
MQEGPLVVSNGATLMERGQYPPHGCTEALALGFTPELLVDLVRGGLATAAPGITYAGNRPIEVTRLRITEIGRQALAGTYRPRAGA